MADFDTDVLRGPIPGQSLTTEPGGRPWEQPPQFVHAEEALNFYVDSITMPKRASALFMILEREYPVISLVDTMIMAGVMQGLHTVDVGILIAPALFTLITGLADRADIKYVTGLEEETEGPNMTMVEQAVAEANADRDREVKENRQKINLDDEIHQAMTTFDIEPEMQEAEKKPPVEDLDRGLMQRPVMEQGEI